MRDRVSAEWAQTRRAGLTLFVGCALLLLAACTGGGQEAIATATVAPLEATLAPGDSQPTRGQAVVDSIDLLIMESFPVQVSVAALGNLPDGCTQIDEVISQRTDNAFRVAITTLRQPTAACTPGPRTGRRHNGAPACPARGPPRRPGAAEGGRPR